MQSTARLGAVPLSAVQMGLSSDRALCATSPPECMARQSPNPPRALPTFYLKTGSLSMSVRDPIRRSPYR